MNDTVVADVTPGVSTVESHSNAPFSTPVWMASVAIAVGPYATAPVGPRAVNVAVDAARTDGGVVTAATVNVTGVSAARMATVPGSGWRLDGGAAANHASGGGQWCDMGALLQAVVC